MLDTSDAYGNGHNEELVGRTHRILKSGQTPQEVYQKLWETITTGGEWHGEFCNRKKNGDLYWESASISPVTDTKGNIVRFMAVKEDVTERKGMEAEARQGNRN